MPLFHLIILAVIQGITEFLPISSSGHLVLAHWSLQDGDLSLQTDTNHLIDIAVHIGTLFAVMLYFRSDIVKLISGAFKTLTVRGSVTSEDKTLFKTVFIASIPVIIAGAALHFAGKDILYNLHVIAWVNLVFACLLWLSDRNVPVHHTLQKLSLKHAFLIGIAQVFALLPGASRSGATISAARYLGYNRSVAARFSMLLAVVTISGAGTLGGFSLIGSQDIALNWDILFAILFSFITALGAIAFMMKWLERSSFTPFVIYRLLLSAVLLGFLYL